MRLNTPTAKTQLIGPCLLALCAALSACATTNDRHVWTEQALDAETAQFNGEFDRAEAEYRRLLPEAPNDEKRRWILFNLAAVAEQRGDIDEAKRRYASVYDEPIVDLAGANSMLAVARLTVTESAEQGMALFVRVIANYPGEVAAEFALDEFVQWHVSNGSAQALDEELTKLHERVEGSEIADNLLFNQAMMRDQHLGDEAGALQTLRALWYAYGDGPLGDDALWEMANIYRRHQAWDPATQLLELLCAKVEKSWFVGSYASQWVDDAVYDLGLIYLLHYGDYAAAEKYFTRYIREFPDSLLVDDAAWNRVEVHRLSGDDAKYRRALQDFLRDYPDSRHARRATARQEMM